MDGVFSKRGSGANHRFQGFILTVCLGLCVGPTSIQGSDVTAAVGATVTLSAPDTGIFLSCIWYRGSSENPTQRILSYVPGGSPPQSNGPQYSGRETGLSTGALQIRDVRTMDTGSYFVSKVSMDGSPATATRTLTVYVCLGLCVEPTLGQGSYDVAVGATVTLSAPVTSANFFSCTWYKGTSVNEGQRILSYRPTSSPPQSNGPQYSGRETALSTGALEIRDVRTTDNGSYFVSMTLEDGNPATASRTLTVYEKVTEPTVAYISSQLVENRGPAVITCVTSSAAVTIHWFFNNSPVLPDNIRLKLSADNRTLTIANVSRSDARVYQCEAINAISSSMSKPQTLTVAYGPDSKIDPSGPQTLLVGATLSLTCIVESVPGPSYEWFINSTDLKQSVSKLTIDKVSTEDSGSYSCVAHNSVTGLSAKASVDITVSGDNSAPDNIAPDNSAPDWRIAVGVSVGVLLFAALIATGVVLWYKRRTRTLKAENTYENPVMAQDPDPHYENVRKGNPVPSATQTTDADSAYMALTHKDQATYDQLKRSKT